MTYDHWKTTEPDPDANTPHPAAAPAQGEHRHKAPVGECAYCDSERAANNNFHPAHDASERCESGKHSHCSCDFCF